MFVKGEVTAHSMSMVQRLRVLQPSTRPFQIEWDNSVPLAPGLTMVMSVSFLSTSVTVHHDKLTILSGTPAVFLRQCMACAPRLFSHCHGLCCFILFHGADEDRIEVPLHCFGIRGDIQFNTHLAMGPQTVGERNVVNLELRNEGLGEGTFEITTDEDSVLKFIPAKGIDCVDGCFRRRRVA